MLSLWPSGVDISKWRSSSTLRTRAPSRVNICLLSTNVANPSKLSKRLRIVSCYIFRTLWNNFTFSQDVCPVFDTISSNCLQDWNICANQLRQNSQSHSISVYKEAQGLCKQYEHAPGNSVGEVRPARHPFFQKLGPCIDLRLQKSERENGFMWALTFISWDIINTRFILFSAVM